MKCFDERVRLQGTYDTLKARHLGIAFKKCDPEERTTCKSEEEITDWIKGKFVITAINNWFFRQNEFSDKRLTAET